MDVDPHPTDVFQRGLFDLDDTSSGLIELFPAVWDALEELVSPTPEQRQQALKNLLGWSAHRLSPLVAYLLFTRLTDPDMAVRAQVIQALGDLYVVDHEGRAAPDSVRNYLSANLCQMRTRPIYSLLETAIYYPGLESAIARLLNGCPYAGRHLVDILADRRMPRGVRMEAVHFIGRVGYLEAIPELERLANRLEARLYGQQAMPFTSNSPSDEVELLPAIHATLTLLHAP
jgi:HEAT repeat protein